jgi:mannose-6-phosphate isomerase-like protein (cupin superfamily)
MTSGSPARTLSQVSYTVVDASSVDTGPGPHPAASPFDKRISEHLGVTGFEVYLVELPAYAETTVHDHVADQVEDMYAFLRGGGWLIVDGESMPVRPGQFAAVTMGSRRQVRAGADGLVLIAVCAPRPRA